MAQNGWVIWLRVAALFGLLSSTALLSDYLADVPSFCGAASGCGAIRASALSHMSLGAGKFVPLPAIGVIGFAALFVSSMVAERAVLVLAMLGGAAGALLLGVQAFVLRQFCWLCVCADLSAVAAAGAAFALWRRPRQLEREAPESALAPWSFWALGAITILAPLGWPQVKPSPPVPARVLAYYVPGKVNVVEFADFECPACRRFHQILKPILAKHQGLVHFVRLNKPLGSHRHARDAARAAICAEAQRKLEPMADALFAADDLTPSGIDRLAATLGLDASAFDRCMVDAATEARVERESNLLDASELEGLPTTYIGSKRLLGVQRPEAIEDAIERAARSEGVSGVSPWLYWPAVVLGVVWVLWAGRLRPRVQ